MCVCDVTIMIGNMEGSPSVKFKLNIKVFYSTDVQVLSMSDVKGPTFHAT